MKRLVHTRPKFLWLFAAATLCAVVAVPARWRTALMRSSRTRARHPRWPEQAERAGCSDRSRSTPMSWSQARTKRSTWRRAMPGRTTRAHSRLESASPASTSRSTGRRAGTNRPTPAGRLASASAQSAPILAVRQPSGRSEPCPGTTRTTSCPTATPPSHSARGRVPGGFRWSNGSRLYYANLTSSFSGARSEAGDQRLRGDRSFPDGQRPGRSGGDKGRWMPPVIVSSRTPHSSPTTR